MAVDQDVARVGPHQAHDHVERRGFARTVGAQQADHLAFLYHQGHVLDHLAAAIRLLQVPGFEPARVGRTRGVGCRPGHFLSPPSVVLERKVEFTDGVAGAAAGAEAAARGAMMARTRPPGLAELALDGLPSTVNTSVRLL